MSPELRRPPAGTEGQMSQRCGRDDFVSLASEAHRLRRDSLDGHEVGAELADWHRRLLAAAAGVGEGYYGRLPLPDAPGHYIDAVAIEGPRDHFVLMDRATDEDYQAAAALSRQRLRRCKAGSPRWHWYRAVIAEHERRRRGRLTLIGGGSS